MSILIKGADMPKTCGECILKCEQKIFPPNARAPKCPLVEVPTPHGRLIDADKMIEALVERFCGAEATIIDLETRYVNLFVITNLLKQAPAEIEAEEG